jgi:hypothetical protein
VSTSATLLTGDASTGAITVGTAINPTGMTTLYTVGQAGGGVVNLNANVSTSNNASLTVALGAAVAVSAGAGNITFSGTVNGAQPLTITATGNTTFFGRSAARPPSPPSGSPPRG